jgi:hypothetical protein
MTVPAVGLNDCAYQTTAPMRQNFPPQLSDGPKIEERFNFRGGPGSRIDFPVAKEAMSRMIQS